MPEVICPQCGKTFSHYPSQPRKFCSNACKSLSQKKEVTTTGVGVMVAATCAACGKEFQTRRRRPSKFCSHSCAARTNNAPLKKREMKVCQQCGKEFEPKGSPATRPGTFCSNNCRNENRRRETAAHRYPKHQVNGKDVRIHRQVVEERIGRGLAPNEVVHHLDEDKHNYDLANLVVLTRSAHSRLHAVLYKMEKAGVRSQRTK